MGNSAKRKARKKEKEQIKQITYEYSRKSQDTLFLFLGGCDSGKTEFINQLLQIKSNTNIKDINWFKNTYKMNSFIVNQYASNQRVSCSQYQYLEIAMKHDLDIKHIQPIENQSTNNISINDINTIRIIISYYSKQIIPKDIIEVINKFISIPTITSYIFDEFARITGCGSEDHSGIFEFWDIVGPIELQQHILPELYVYLDAIIFVVDISGYNEYIMNELTNERVNKLSFGLVLMHSVAKQIQNLEIAMILFLNKKDQFVEKIKSIPFEWNEYKDEIKESNIEYCDDNRYEKYSNFIRHQFQETVNDVNNQQQIYSHMIMTCATDRNNVERVFNDVQHIVIKT
eukprot:77708_1